MFMRGRVALRADLHTPIWLRGPCVLTYLGIYLSHSCPFSKISIKISVVYLTAQVDKVVSV